MLKSGEIASEVHKDGDKYSLDRAAQISFSNLTNESKKIFFDINFAKGKDLKELFKIYCDLTQNVITDGDFRNDPNVFVNMLSGIDYFLFAGDGYCTALTFQFSELARKILHIDIESKYCRSKDGSYTHAYNRYQQVIFDTALKKMGTLEELTKNPPVGWIYTLIKRAGLLLFDSLTPEERDFLFDDVMIRSIDFMNQGNSQLVYRTNAQLKNIHSQFLNLVSNESVEIDIRKNDFSWKEKYRDAVLRQTGQNEYLFFKNLSESTFIELPRNSTLGTVDKHEEPLLEIYESILYGRRLLKLELNLKAKEYINLSHLSNKLAFINCSDSELQINNLPCKLTKRGKRYWAGRRVFGRHLADISSPIDTNLSLYIQFNALALNSPYLIVRHESGIECNERRV